MSEINLFDMSFCCQSQELSTLLSSARNHFADRTQSPGELAKHLTEEKKRWESFRSQGYLLQSCHARTYLNTIYKGTRLVDRQPIAIKFLSLDNYPEVVQAYNLQQDRMIQKFHREIRLLNQVKDIPGIVTILDAGEMAGMSYHVCQWVEGRSVLELPMASGTVLNLREKLLIVLRAARSIQQLHERGLVHRDITPDHLYVTSGFQTCLIDFGMAEFLKENSPHNAKQYILHDIYTTGLMLYEMWIGERVFAYGQPTLPKEVIQAFERLQALSQVSPIAEVVKRAMVCDARVAAHVTDGYEHYPNMATFVTHLERLLGDHSGPGSLLSP
jgi:serine/threonine protein kinase